MPEYVRVKDPVSGHEYSYTPAQVAATGLSESDQIDKAPLAASGEPAPVKYRTPLGAPLPGSKKDRERARSRARSRQTTPAATESGPNDGQSVGTTEGN